MRETSVANGTNRVYKKNAPILYQGEVPREGYQIIKGVVKVYTYDEDLNEVIVAFLKNGDFLPMQWLLGKNTSSTYYYETMVDCRLYSFSKAAFEDAISTNRELHQKIFDKLTADQNALMLRVTAMGQSRASDKILYIIYYLLQEFGISRDGNNFVINLQITHQLIANLTGLSRETITTELNVLKRENIITYTSKDYRVVKQALIKRMGEGNFIDLLARQNS